MKTIAIILAGGTGSRMNATMPKQFLDLDGRMVIEHSIDTFDSHPGIDEVAVVVHPDWRSTMEEVATRRQWGKLTKIVDGGDERYMSSINAVMAYIDYPDDTNLLMHDAARPLVSADIVSRVVAELRRHEAVGVAVPSTDTVWEVHPDIGDDYAGRFIARTPERRLMWLAQTPQAFRLPLLRDAYQRAINDPEFQATDDCSVVRKYVPGVKIAVVEGDAANMKLTTRDDIEQLTYQLEHQKQR